MDATREVLFVADVDGAVFGCIHVEVTE